MALSKTVKIVEVGLRDGLQNEKVVLSVAQKVELGKRLVSAGINRLEAGAFVRFDKIPQMEGTDQVLSQLQSWNAKPHYSVLVPNEKGMLEALGSVGKGSADSVAPPRSSSEATPSSSRLASDPFSTRPFKYKPAEVAVFAGCSESFSKRNINCTIEESFERFRPVFTLAKKNKIKVRGYLSVCFGCPFEGDVPEKKVVEMAHRLYKMGAFEISVGDTIGVAHVGQVQSLFKKLKRRVPAKALAGHFHDTRGQALANILAAYNEGISVFDSSIGGLGGCPYAPAATGNVATEDVLYMFQKMGVKTGIDLNKILDIAPWLKDQMGKSLPSKLSNVGLLKPQPIK